MYFTVFPRNVVTLLTCNGDRGHKQKAANRSTKVVGHSLNEKTTNDDKMEKM